MYVLQRNGDVYEMRQQPLPGAMHSRYDLLFNAGRTSHGRDRRDAWEHFIKTGRINDPSLPHPIAASWRRCRDLGVDPLMPRCCEFAPMTEIECQTEAYTELAKDVELQVYNQIRDKDLLITVTEANGRILRTCGSKEVLLEADRLHFGPGAVWSEDSVGTNAISLALSEGIPAQVMGEEHFCSSHQAWGCTATPIFTPFGGLWGCFDISGACTADHSQALWLVMGAAREIEHRLLSASLANMENKSRVLMNSLFSSMPVGIVMVDEEGHITYANSLALRMMGQRSDLRGHSADAFFEYTPYARQQRQRPRADSVPIRCLGNPAINAQIMPLISDGMERRYSIITLNPEGPARSTRTAVPARSMLRRESRRFGDILYRSDIMARVVDKAQHMAQGPAPILLHGETGTGKELFARAIHAAGGRKEGPFIALNCGALPRELIQSELFGYERGSFTGAVEEGRPGKFELADKGILFLDEISEMPLEMQVNLLRPLENRTITRIGGKRSFKVDFRLISATNRNLDELLASGNFRKDLFYRIHVLALEIPPLRERRDDIALVAEHHCRHLCLAYDQPFAGLSAEALRLMQDYDWPGNVRELVHCMEYALNMARGNAILPEHLPSSLCDQSKPALPSPTKAHTSTPLSMSSFNLNSLEAHAIKAALHHYEGNMLQAAKALGIGRNTLYAKLRRIGS